MSRMTILLTAALLMTSGAALAADIPTGAAACSGCHPSGRSAEVQMPRLNGRNPADITNAMLEFRSGQRPATVMSRIAKGFTDEEIKAIAVWYGAQKD